MCTTKTMRNKTVHPMNARKRRVKRRWSSNKPMATDPTICANQYTRLFRDRARMLKSAPLYSLNSIGPTSHLVHHSFISTGQLTPRVKPVGCEEHGEE